MVEAVRRRRPAVPDAVQADHTVTVTSSLAGDEKARTERIAVRKFVTEPAYVRVNHGLTQNMGNYESLRVDVAITLPCYAEEISKALTVASDMAADFLDQEVGKYE